VQYPATTLLSIASSGPVKAEENFYSYMDVVKQAIDYFGNSTSLPPSYTGSDCNNAFRAAAEEVMMKNYSQLAVDFSTCSNITSDMDRTNLLSLLMGNVQVFLYVARSCVTNRIKEVYSL
jgi:Serine carboxypeptidase S28